MGLAETALVVLNAEVLVDLGLIFLEVTPNFLDTCLFLEGTAELAFGASVGVVAHQVLRQEDGRVEALQNSLVDGILRAA